MSYIQMAQAIVPAIPMHDNAVWTKEKSSPPKSPNFDADVAFLGLPERFNFCTGG